jgi:hypothetical protein
MPDDQAMALLSAGSSLAPTAADTPRGARPGAPYGGRPTIDRATRPPLRAAVIRAMESECQNSADVARAVGVSLSMIQKPLAPEANHPALQLWKSCGAGSGFPERVPHCKVGCGSACDMPTVARRMPRPD